MEDLDIGGGKVIGDTKTRIDFPYTCKKCGSKTSIEKRHSWNHNCKTITKKEEEAKMETEIKTEVKEAEVVKEENRECCEPKETTTEQKFPTWMIVAMVALIVAFSLILIFGGK